ncbi:hypothetical protein AC249_AIPGENE6450 [Exaiptasia diaphana]|nr:hypothetical protein AC249_AIPGENE6450 [Exaiptasia diaphana]
MLNSSALIPIEPSVNFQPLGNAASSEYTVQKRTFMSLASEFRIKLFELAPEAKEIPPLGVNKRMDKTFKSYVQLRHGQLDDFRKQVWVAKFSQRCWEIVKQLDERRKLTTYCFKWLMSTTSEEEIFHSLTGVLDNSKSFTSLNNVKSKLKKVGELEKALHYEKNASKHLKTIADQKETIACLRENLSKALAKVCELEKVVEKMVEQESLIRQEYQEVKKCNASVSVVKRGPSEMHNAARSLKDISEKQQSTLGQFPKKRPAKSYNRRNESKKKKLDSHESLIEEKEFTVGSKITEIEAVWDDIEAPYRKVGRVCWKDFKTLQLDIPPVHETLMKMQLMVSTDWEKGYLNDEVIDEYIALLEKKAKKEGKNILTANSKFFQLLVEGKPWRKKVVDIHRCTIAIIDPLGVKKNHSKIFDQLRVFLQSRGLTQKWRLEEIPHPCQHDAIAECIMFQPGDPIEFSSEDVDEYRYVVAEKPLDQK